MENVRLNDRERDDNNKTGLREVKMRSGVDWLMIVSNGGLRVISGALSNSDAKVLVKLWVVN